MRKIKDFLLPKQTKEVHQIINVKNADILHDLNDFSQWFPFLNPGNAPEFIQAQRAFQYYKRCAPLFTAVNMVSDKIASLKPRVFDKKSEQFIEHEVLELLAHPFGDLSWMEFFKQFVTYYIVAGNNYMIATGPIERPPLEIVNFYPGSVNILPDTYDGYAGKYLITGTSYTINFLRSEKSGYFRFVDETGTKELWQTKTFNPAPLGGAGYSYYGLSLLTPIYYELEQHMQSSVHNLSLLMNGGRLSLIFSTDRNLTDPQAQSLRRMIRQYSSSENAGKTVLLDNGIKVDEIGMNNKDMDFIELKQSSANSIYNILKIPLPLISVEKSTLNNMEIANLQLYDNAIIPLAERLFEELTLFLMPRYKNSENLIITYRESEVLPLQERTVKQTAEKASMGIYTVNELRAQVGLDPAEAGDNIFMPATNQPITSLAQQDESQDEKDYADALKRAKFIDGSPLKKELTDNAAKSI